jgi:hypothetical protein
MIIKSGNIGRENNTKFDVTLWHGCVDSSLPGEQSLKSPSEIRTILG